ncbi:MAG: integrase core domain-containing protein [Burkholderia sp.]
MDHGSQYRSDDFRAQLKFWGITPSYAFVAEPQTNGVAERFNRTMKEQAIHGRLFNNVEEVGAAAVAFKDRYNREWRLEKLVFKTPPRSPSGSALATCRLIAKSCLAGR